MKPISVPGKPVNLSSLLGNLAPTIDIVDVGAMWLDEAKPAYNALLSPGRARVIGFEPVQSECDKLNSMKMRNHTFLPYFIGDGRRRTFYLTKPSFTASLYEPDPAVINPFFNLPELMHVVEKTEVDTRRLDDLPEIKSFDLLKIDVQGAEVDVMRGAERLLKSACVVQTEINFVPMYKGMALFADVDVEMRRQGYMIHYLTHAMGRPFRPVALNNDVNQNIRQILWGDAVYIRDFRTLGDLPPEMLLKMAVILNDQYNSYDLAALCLQHYDEKTKAGLWQVFMSRLSGRLTTTTPPIAR